jgi:hypothetical protein
MISIKQAKKDVKRARTLRDVFQVMGELLGKKYLMKSLKKEVKERLK